jgi:hypothetical protein
VQKSRENFVRPNRVKFKPQHALGINRLIPWQQLTALQRSGVSNDGAKINFFLLHFDLTAWRKA